MAAAALVTSAAAFGYVEWRLGQVKRVTVHGVAPVGRSAQSPHETGGPPMTILVVGSDTRAALHEPGDNQFGSATQVAGARSDTIILARVAPASHQIALLSVPRDLWVPIPGYGNQKINFAIGVGADLLVSVLRQQLGIEVNHYVDVDFDSFRDISNAVGGVPQYFPTAVRDQNAALSIPAPGCYSLKGDLALAFVRSRDYQYSQGGRWVPENSSDLARIQRQQLFIRKLVKKAEQSGLGNPITLNRIIGGVTQNLTVDSTFSTAAMIRLAQELRTVNADAIVGWTLPTREQILPGPNDVLLPQPAEDRAMINQFLAFGTTPPAATATTSRGSSTTSSVPSTLPPASVAVEVDNGSGIAGQAGATAAALRAAGFPVVSIGTAPSYTYLSSQIRYGPSGLAAAQALQGRIGGGATLAPDPTLQTSTVVLVTGSSFTGILPASGSSGAGTATSYPGRAGTAAGTSTTVPPPTTSTTYVLPGTKPGVAPPAC